MQQLRQHDLDRLRLHPAALGHGSERAGEDAFKQGTGDHLPVTRLNTGGGEMVCARCCPLKQGCFQKAEQLYPAVGFVDREAGNTTQSIRDLTCVLVILDSVQVDLDLDLGS